MSDTGTAHQTVKFALRRLKNPLALCLTLAACCAAAVSVEAQRGRAVVRSLAPAFGRAAVAAESRALARVTFTHLPRQSITPAFSAAARTTLTREGVASALRSFGIRRRAFNVAAGSMTRTPRVFGVAAKLPALNSGSYAVGRTAAEMTRAQSLRQVFDIRALMSPRLSPRARLTLGKSLSDATNRAAAARALEKQAASINKIFDRSARLHKNSRFYRAPSHVYVIVGPDGRLYKVGESSAGLLSKGLSRRAQAQVKLHNRQLTPGVNGQYRSRIIKTFDSKQAARDYERRLIVRYKEKYAGRRLVLPGNRERFAELNQNQKQPR